jgi:hypothetical protein
MSSWVVELARSLLLEHFGEVIADVGRILMDDTQLPLIAILQRAPPRLKLKQAILPCTR